MDLNVLRNISYGLYVVSSTDNGRATGCMANSVMQINVTPNTVIASINRDNFTNKCIKETGKFGVSILAETSNPTLISTFGFQSGRNVDKFAEVPHKLIDDIPVVCDSSAYLVCKVINTMETSTHTIFLGEIVDCDYLDNGDNPMTYAYYHKEVKGKSQAPKKDGVTSYVCSVCGYVYEGDEMPDDYICPICKQGKDKFI
ncbi:MAG: flavin reductase [Clostridium sp.]